jgi:solute carrier family 13 (sodium-dependent dicarboxylate transporter), member 2/3/5
MAIWAFIDLDPANGRVTLMAGIAVWMAVWWMTESLPLAATALLPVVLYPLTGVMDGRSVAPIYFNHIILLFIGGFLVALAMERWGLHKRIALRVLLLFGSRPAGLLFGFMAATAFLSMWISNTATTMMMIPIAMSVLATVDSESGKLSTGLLLGIAYSASIGGAATLVGTPPNLSLSRILAIQFPNAPEITFGEWMVFGVPLSAVFLVIVWALLSRLYLDPDAGALDRSGIESDYRGLGRMGREERSVLVVFVSLALLWVFRRDLRLGTLVVPGWSGVLPYPSFLNDGVVAIGLALILFVIPSRNAKSGRVLDWDVAAKLPWHIVLLFGGGFALAQGFVDSGLSAWLGAQLVGLKSVHPVFLVAVICLLITFLTELTSNTATAEMFLPILASLSIAIEVNPLLLMVPATLSCSFAFMLPVATPPNAIIFGTNRIQIRDMVRTGIWLNLTGVILVILAIVLLGPIAFGIDPGQTPVWMNP